MVRMSRLAMISEEIELRAAGLLFRWLWCGAIAVVGTGHSLLPSLEGWVSTRNYTRRRQQQQQAPSACRASWRERALRVLCLE